MINGVHTLLYSRDVDAARAFLRDALGLASIDSGGGWLIFAAPPAELAVHPIGDDDAKDPAGGLYLMCDDIEGTVTELRSKGVEITKPVLDEGYGLFTAMRVPGGPELGLYQPRHPTALHLTSSTSATRGKRGKKGKG
jgi:catechol 2,3-dioxygenase-like lactoylglutathione lyase family enzyme